MASKVERSSVQFDAVDVNKCAEIEGRTGRLYKTSEDRVHRKIPAFRKQPHSRYKHGSCLAFACKAGV